MKLAALKFLVVLVGFHCLAGGKTYVDYPLSMLRDDDWRGIGYTLFGLLLLLGLLAIERQASHAGGKRNELGKKRRVYTLDPEKAWARRRPSRDLATT